MLPVSHEMAFDLELLEAHSSSTGGDGFAKLIKETEESIAISVLGQNLTTSVSGGSYAAAQVHNDVRHGLMEADAAMLTGALRRHLLRPWADARPSREVCR